MYMRPNPQGDRGADRQAGHGGCGIRLHGPAFDFKVAVFDRSLALDGGRGISVVPLVFGHLGHFLLAHGQMQFAIVDIDISRVEEGRRPA